MNGFIRLIIIVIVCGMLPACDALPISRGNSGGGVIDHQTGNTPRETAESFLATWSQDDFETLHSFLHPRSLEIYPLADFVELYTDTHSDMTVSGVSYTINSVEEQGTSAAIGYDVVFETVSFGQIEDAGRTLRLVEQGGAWTVAWSPMDIINGMTANVRLDPSRQFAPRGNILDTNGQFLVNEAGTTMGLIMRLSDMLDVDECTDLLSRIMLRPRSYFTSLYVDYQALDSAFFVGEIDGETYNRNQADLERICGTNIEVEFIGNKVRPRTGRTYFGHGAAAHITGYISFVPDSGAYNTTYWQERGYSDRDFVGLSGIEFTYQDELAGTPQQSLRLIDSSGVILRELGSASGTPSAPVTLTIDRELQWDTAQAFIDAWNFAGENWATRALGGAAVVMDVNSGAVLSMFSFPTYDPAIFFPESSYFSTNTTNSAASAQIQIATSPGRFLPTRAPIVNHAYTEQYSPGSVAKIMSSLAAADSGAWQPEQSFFCDLTWDGSSFGDTGGIREDWRVVSEQEAAGEISMSTALTTSCNPFFWEIGALMFQQRPNLLSTYLRRWGFGQPTDLVGLTASIEASGSIPEPNNVTIAINNVIGQGDTQVTAVQMARLVSAVANGGTLYQPYLVKQAGNEAPFEPVVEGELGVSDSALQVTYEGMCDVTIDPDFGTSTSAFAENQVPPSYSSCGKTGTAQTGDAPNAWYVAFAPADNPQVAVAVVVPNSRNGSEISAPITRRILDGYFDGPVAPYPEWWDSPYVPVELPQGVGG